MKNILNQLDNVIFIINEHGRIQFANQPALNFFSLTSLQENELSISQLLNLDSDNLAFYLNKGNIPGEYLVLKTHKKAKCYFEITRQNWYGIDCYMVIIRLRKKEITAPLLQQFVEEMPFSVWIQNDKNQCIYMNPANRKSHQELFSELAHLPIEDSLEEFLSHANHSGWITKVYTDNHLQKFLENIHKAHQYGQTIVDEHLIQDSNGKTKTIVDHIIPLYNPLDDKIYTGCVSRDITLAKALQKVETKQLDELNYLRNVLCTSCYTTDYTLIFDKLKSGISHELNADRIGLWLFESENECIRYVYDFGEGYEELNIPTVKPMTREDVADLPNRSYLNKIVDIAERTDLKCLTTLQDKQFGFMGSYEIRGEHSNQFLGFLNVLYHYDNPPSLQQGYIIKNTCQQLALLLQNNLLHGHIRQEFLKREKIEKELEALLSTTVDLIAIINFKTGHFVKANDKWQELLGWSSEELISNMRLQDLESDSYHELSLHRLSDLNDNEFLHHCKTKCRSKHGEQRLLEINYKRLENEDLAIFTAKDVTEREKLKLQKKELEDVIRMESLRNEFFANISHELRTPLNIIISTAQLLDSSECLTDVSNDKKDKYIKNLKQNAYRLLRLVNNIIDITRIDAGYYQINLHNHNIISLIENITDSTLDYMHSKNIEFTFDTEVEEEYIACDPELIERIILNLLSNSIKYSKDNKQDKIWLMITLEDDYVVISVRDNGLGIPEEKLSTIFERFIQVDELLTRKREGSGIGLSLVKSLVEMHNGLILVKSQLGEGSEFIIKLPRVTIIEEASSPLFSYDLNSSSQKYIVEFSDINH